MSSWLTVGLLGVTYGPTWGWKDPTVLAMFGAAAVLIVLWVWSELRSDTPLVDMTMMRIPAVWTTNLTAVLFGFGLYAMFVTVPQFAQTPTSVGYGFGASVTRSGVYLVPFAIAMLVIAPFTGRLARAVGSKEPPRCRIAVLRCVLRRLDHCAQPTLEHSPLPRVCWVSAWPSGIRPCRI